ncbi:MAG TPA: N(4)-(beta-N-acetylglucosaminyl)-L-asparaginase [Candidatus Binatia bacterium]|nr:N(4)-(beta-N-acetylglucosaminyl)-L-asparaginase [Candidatus Binatia bacterium]
MGRRKFIKSATVVGATLAVAKSFGQAAKPEAGSIKPIVIASGNGMEATARAMELIQQGRDALDAVIEGVTIVEDDPKDNSVGYGGLPNEDGVVELDASVMHGATGRGGAVAALQNIKNPTRVARTVMERSDHVLIVGAGALHFARAHGFKEENLLTDDARAAWLKWKETLSDKDDWLPPHDENTKNISQVMQAYKRHYGTINCNAIDLKGNISGCTTTSGLSFKIAGRVGDSPILGAGLWIDNEVGAAGSTGRGEANLLACSSVMVVEYMRQGKSPEAACLMACERIAKQTKMRRLLDDDGRPNFDVRFYAINKRGEYGSASLWSGGTYVINTGEKQSKKLDSVFLFKKQK